MILRPARGGAVRVYDARGGSMVDIGKAILTQIVPDVMDSALQLGRSGVAAITRRGKRKLGGDPASAPVPAKIYRPVARTQREEMFDDNNDPFADID